MSPCRACGHVSDDMRPAIRFDWTIIEGEFECRDSDACYRRRFPEAAAS